MVRLFDKLTTARSSEEKEKAAKIAESTKVVIDGNEYRVKNVDASKLEIKGRYTNFK